MRYIPFVGSAVNQATKALLDNLEVSKLGPGARATAGAGAIGGVGAAAGGLYGLINPGEEEVTIGKKPRSIPRSRLKGLMRGMGFGAVGGGGLGALAGLLHKRSQDKSSSEKTAEIMPTSPDTGAPDPFAHVTQQASDAFRSFGAPKQPPGGGLFGGLKNLGNTLGTAYQFNKNLSDVRRGGQGMWNSAGDLLGAVPGIGSNLGNAAFGAARQFANNPTLPGATNAGYGLGSAALQAMRQAAGPIGNFAGYAAQAGGALPGLISNGFRLGQQTGRIPQLPFFKTSAFALGVASVGR